MTPGNSGQPKYEDLKVEVGEARWPAFLQFISTGMADAAFLEHLDHDERLKEAVDKAYRRQVGAVADFAAALRADPAEPRAARPGKPSRAGANTWLKVALAACLVLALLAGAQAFRLGQQNANRQGDFDRSVKIALVELLAHTGPSNIARPRPQQTNALTLDARIRGTMVKHLHPLLEDPNPDVQLMAYRALGKIAPDLAVVGVDATVVDTVIAGLKAPAPAIRKQAAITLSRLGPRAQPALAALYQGMQDKSPEVRNQCAEAYGLVAAACGDRESIPGLVEPYRRNDLAQQQLAGYALQAMGPAAGDAVQPLSDSLKAGTARPEVTLRVLGAIGKRAVPSLIPALGKEETQAYAAAALEQIGHDAIPQLTRAINAADDGGFREAAKDVRDKINASPPY